MNQREAAKVLRQLAKDAHYVIGFVLEPGSMEYHNDTISMLMGVYYYRYGRLDDNWRQVMFDEYNAIRVAAEKYADLRGFSITALEDETYNRASTIGKTYKWFTLYIKNCISILHEGQIYH